ncbi:hypothetical protein [uncultured Alistipes sp.]|uniref:hypothetical protein n=2 Tax=uncultured Alistipes sp. TaxID=538949 RepID=UPI00272C98FB|nr:hypothetical protein [uncultured Alistipes sp.]
MTTLTLSLCVGAAAGTLDVIPMLLQRLSLRSCLSAFCTYLFAAVIIFHCNLPYLPWWADGMAVTLMMALPVVLNFVGKERRATPLVLLNAVLLGFLLSVTEHYFG